MGSDPSRLICCDISSISQADRNSGIERVVRAVLSNLRQQPPSGYRVVPTIIRNGKIEVSAALGSDSIDGAADLERRDRSGDHFLMLDWAPDQMASLDGWLSRFRADGGRVTVVVYDLLPIELPSYFPDWLRHTTSDWLDQVVRHADNIACISLAVAKSFSELTARRLQRRESPLKLSFFHLGGDIDASRPSVGKPQDARAIIERLDKCPYLMVLGTVEPRKGHDQTLAAMELLWSEGVDIGLLIVGRQGWMVDELAEKIRAAARSHRVLWLEGISDEFMADLYSHVFGALLPSLGEGFGLPLVEASVHGIPIIARDIPVFKEVAGTHARYFSGRSPIDLAAAIRSFLADGRRGDLPASAEMRRLDWATSASQLSDIMFAKRSFMEVDLPSAFDRHALKSKADSHARSGRSAPGQRQNRDLAADRAGAD